MRLWHENIIDKLPNNQLLGQHRECCALRGLGWGRKHSTVDYVFKHAPIELYRYHMVVVGEMYRRGYKVNKLWIDPLYRGLRADPYKSLSDMGISSNYSPIYLEHDDKYLSECLDNLYKKGIDLELDIYTNITKEA